jgi:hypothetical protein
VPGVRQMLAHRGFAQCQFGAKAIADCRRCHCRPITPNRNWLTRNRNSGHAGSG